MRGMTGGTPARAGIGLRAPHVDEILATRPDLGWLEVHAENYMGGGPALARLEALRQDYPVSLHGVGLSLGSAEGLNLEHLARLHALADRLAPCLVSEHLAWSVSGGVYLNHLLPLPWTDAALIVVSDNVRRAQDRLGRRLLVENPSSYLRFLDSPIPEAEFVAELTRRTGCGVLCDVNNLVVSAANVGLEPLAYLDALPADAVDEIHLAGHAENDADGVTVLIDDHGSRVRPAVWDLYEAALARFGSVPTLIEWDTDLPALAVLQEEAAAAERRLAASSGAGHHALAG
jgi:uncharacterized protein (UPF0276 family)